MMKKIQFTGIETDRLMILPFNETYITEQYISWLNDPEVVKYSEQRHVKHDRKSSIAFLKSMRDMGSIFAAICLKKFQAGTQHIGNLAANFDQPNGTVDVTIMIGEKTVWGQGLGFEAWDALLNYLLKVIEVRKITAGSMIENKAMLRIMKQSKMNQEARKQCQFILNDKEIDAVYYCRFSEKNI